MVGMETTSSSDESLPRILIVDDSLDSVNALGRLLSKHGYEIHVALDWASALETAEARLPDIILMDLAMPEMDGVHLARLVRENEKLKDKVLIAVTGYADQMHREQCEVAGFDSFLPKPVAWDELKSTIDRLWSKSKQATDDKS